MPSSRGIDTLGQKIGPKIIAAVTQSIIATKKGLLPTEHKLRVGAMREVLTMAGDEVAEHIRPFLDAAVEANPDMHPAVKGYLDRTASGKYQLQALAGHLVLGGAASALSTVLNNEIAPLAYAIVGPNPHLRLDPHTAASMAATGIFSVSDANNEGAAQGFNSVRMESLIALSQTAPDMASLGELVNRGLLREQDGIYWLERAGYAPTVRQPILDLRRQLLTVADAALAVLRGNISQAEGESIAALNGMSAADFNVFILNTGEPPGIEQMLEAFRRGFIDQATLERGIRQSRVRNEWIPTVEALRFAPMSAADAIEAFIKGYLSESAAKNKAAESGMEPSDFDIASLAAGEPLSRTEMADLVNRGKATISQFQAAIRQSRVKDAYIDLATELILHPMTEGEAVRGYIQGYLTEAETDAIQAANGVRAEDRLVQREIEGIPLSLTEMLRLKRMGIMSDAEVRQGIRESRIKDKYIDAAMSLGVTIPSIFEIRLMLQDSAITDAQATTLLQEHGYQPDVISGIISAFGAGGTAASKQLTVGMITDLYLESAIDATEFNSLLTAEGYSKANAALLQEVADWKIELSQRNALIARVRSMYVGRKVDEKTAQNTLQAENVPSGIIDKVMAEWNLEIQASFRLLSEAQIVDAWSMSLFDQTDSALNTQLALAYLNRLGFTASDAQLLLEIKNKEPLTGAVSGQSAASTQNNQGQTSA